MIYTELPASLKQFVDSVTERLERDADESRFLPRVGESMRELVSRDNWLDPAYAKPHPEYYQQYLLYADPAGRFSVVSFVWGPGQHTPIHDHTVWGVIGMLRGAEIAQGYEIADGGVPRPSGGALRLSPGAVEYVSPRIGDVHDVRNAFDDRVSVSIHAY
ncbi:MAG: cysteine dioxygenase, partial [Proteobacteria bacterium]